MPARHGDAFTDRPGDQVVGVLGGMGPHATAAFFRRLVELTPADKDWDHLRVIVEDNPRMPSRSRAFLFGEESPAPYLAAGARRLEAMGAQLVCVPCNSATYFLADARAAVRARVLDPVEATVLAVRAAGVRRPLVLGGMVTHRAQLYGAALAPHGVVVERPSDDEQDEVARIIEALKHGVPAGAAGADLVARTARVAAAGRARGADAVILGCTEFGLVAEALAPALPVPQFDSNELLARMTVRLARGE